MTEIRHLVEEVRPSEIEFELIEQIIQLQTVCFPDSTRSVEERRERITAMGQKYVGSKQRSPRFFVVRSADSIVAAAMIFPRHITIAGERTITMALAGVCTSPAHRGTHLGQAVVRAAFQLVDDGHFPHSLFQTTPQVRPFYEKLGAAKISNRIVNSLGQEPGANPFWSSEIMIYPGDDQWPDGPVDTLGTGY